jgi:hypothetical protein
MCIRDSSRRLWWCLPMFESRLPSRVDVSVDRLPALACVRDYWPSSTVRMSSMLPMSQRGRLVEIRHLLSACCHKVPARCTRVFSTHCGALRCKDCKLSCLGDGFLERAERTGPRGGQNFCIPLPRGGGAGEVSVDISFCRSWSSVT